MKMILALKNEKQEQQKYNKVIVEGLQSFLNVWTSFCTWWVGYSVDQQVIKRCHFI